MVLSILERISKNSHITGKTQSYISLVYFHGCLRDVSEGRKKELFGYIHAKY